MRKLSLFVVALLCSGLWAFAQSQSDTNQPNPSGQTAGASASSTGGSTMTVDGCLSGSAGSYILKDKATGTTYNLTGNTSKLSAHVGHEVKITGTGSSSASSASSSTPSSSASSSPSSSSSSGQSLNVASVQHVATTCSASQ